MTTASVVTAFSVLERVAELQPVGLSELARAADLPKSTVHRCLQTLQEVGWVESSGGTGARWSMSLRALSVCGGAGGRQNLRDLALPLMSDLQLVTTETVHLCAPDGDVLVLLERLDTSHALRAFLPLGERIPLHASATGLAYLSACPDDVVERYLAGPLEPRTPASLVEPDAIRAELLAVRARGYSINENGLSTGISSLGAPIVSRTGVVGALSVSGPSIRIVPARFEELGTQVVESARRLGRLL